MPSHRRSAVSYLALLSIHVYRNLLSPMMLHTCRYVPTCSEYAQHAVEQQGAMRGAWTTVRRLLRCHPFARGGYDPVPPPAGQGRLRRQRVLAALVARQRPVVANGGVIRARRFAVGEPRQVAG